jgi:potassium-transporting ATPase KdpC subunit
MPHNLSASLRQYMAGLRVLLVLTVVLGIVYPLAVTGVGQLLFRAQANGSLVSSGGHVVGSSLIGQNFTDAKGNPLPQWFQPRPSAAGASGYDPTSSSASNLGPSDPDLVKAIQGRRASAAALDGVAPASVPPDALTASGSGLDPQISPAYAYEQVDRVAKARGLDAAKVKALVASMVQGRSLGFLGEPTVDVLQLNIALQQLGG